MNTPPPRLAIVNTHPIQYYSPLYRALADRNDLTVHVFYGWRGGGEGAYDPGFQQDVAWDVSLLEGYTHTFINNTASDPGTHHFRGLQNPTMPAVIDAWRPDVLLVFGWSFQSLLRAIRYFCSRVPILFRGDSTLLDETGGMRTWGRRFFLSWVYRHVDVALYVGENNREYFRAHGMKANDLHWVPHAVDNERFYDSDGTYANKARSWRCDLGIKSDDRTILFVGKLEPKKAPDILLEAFLRAEIPDAHLLFAGSGPMEGELKATAADHQRVHFLGFQNQSRMPVVYRLGDLFALPSRGPGETWGLAINEAMACQRAIIASDRVGCAHDLVDAKNGRVVEAGSTDDLQNAIASLLNDYDRLCRMQRVSRDRIADWSVRDAARRTQSAVSHVLNIR